MNLVSERTYILGCLVGDPHSAFIYDSSLQAEVRRLLGSLESSDDQERGRLVKKFGSLYESNGPGVWKCILEFSYLLHTTSESRDLFAPVLGRLEHDLRTNKNLANELINELGWYARTPYDFTRELVNLTLERLSKCGGAISELIKNRDADPLLRLAAAHQVVQVRNEEAYQSILQFFIDLSSNQSAESYSRITIPIKQMYGLTGRPGMMLAIDAFERGELGAQGPNLLSGFRNEFATWFLSQPPRPTIKWARVLLKAWRWADDVVDRDNLLTILIDDWCSIPRIAEFVREKIQQNLRSDFKYLAPASRHLRARVLLFGTPRAGETRRDLEERLRAALQGTEENWREGCSRIPLEHATGIAAANIFLSGTSEVRERIILLMANITGSGFQRSFFRLLVKPDIFEQLSSEVQLQLMRSAEFTKNVTSRELNQLLSRENTLGTEITSELQEMILSILRQSNLDRLSEDRAS